jgi:tetratricopeptide (TPR) repeat protein
MDEIKKPNDLLRRQRELRGWSHRRVAEELEKLGGSTDSKQVGKWERGVAKPSPFYQERLCTLFGLTAYELGFVAPSTQPKLVSSDPLPPISKQADQKSEARPQMTFAQGNEDMFYRKRRELLQMLAVAATTFVVSLPDLDWERVENTFSGFSRLDESMLLDMVAINKSFWNLYKVTPQKKVMLDGVLGQLKLVTSFLENSCTSPLRKQLYTVASDLSQLLGEIFFDCNDYESARACYIFGASAAKEANHYDLWSCAFIRHAFLPIYDGLYHDALPLLQAAQKLAYRGDTTLTTRYWVAAVLSDAQAGMGNLYACQQTLDVMDKVTDVRSGCNEGWLRFDGSRLLEQRGACFVKLGQPDIALPVLQKALKQDLTYRRQGMILTDLAFASLQKGEIEQACNYADQVIEIAAQGSGMLRRGIYDLRHRLKPHASKAAVKQLDQKLQALA